MLFNSLEFAIFFPIVAAMYFMLPQRFRTVHLLAASCVFYMAFIPAYILILALTIAIDYTAGLYLEKTTGRARRWLLAGSVFATCLVLFVFKYFYFFTSNVIGLAGLFGWQLSGPSIAIILPVGLSFHTFQSLSYVIEVYYGRQKAESNLVTYATYVMFFPQLVAGPIERPQNLLHQFYECHDFDYARVTAGLKRMAWGFFKKLVIADRLALYVNDVYASPQDFNGLQLTLATVFFAYQIYCDFSGYSDIAIGSARVLGFKLMENFNKPYHAQTISEFWRCWHISLSTWFRDYLYIPMGGSRFGERRHFASLVVTFGVSGLWHGANWTYVFWGLLNAIYLIVGSLGKDARDRTFGLIGMGEGTWPRRLTMVASTFLLTCLGWVLFRAKTVADAWYIWTHFATGWDFGHISTEQFFMRQMPVAVAGIALLEAVELLQNRVSFPAIVARLPLVPRWALYASAVIATIMFGVFRQTQFIYFQF
jgi:D-alanyl-lipoteichoic acid acyltransferase DltB (MBOAT superfamily)